MLNKIRALLRWWSGAHEPKGKPDWRRQLARFAVIAVATFLFCQYVAVPVYIHGDSMAPTYRDGRFNVNWRLRRLFGEWRRGDVVIIRYLGDSKALLKRIVALPDETVEFRDGFLLVNGIPLEEPYVAYPCEWNLPQRTVEPGHYYVIGDNRSMPLEQHKFGQAAAARFIGTPLW